jgi:hypothetical protein
VIRLLYRIDLPNAVLATVLLKQCLAVLSGPFSDLRVTTDRANFNAARTGSGGVRWPGKKDRTWNPPFCSTRTFAIPGLEKNR